MATPSGTHSQGPEHDDLWLYLFDGPFRDRAAFDDHLETKAVVGRSSLFRHVDQASNGRGGHAALMRIEPAHRVIEVGNILYTPALQRTEGGYGSHVSAGPAYFRDLGTGAMSGNATR